jgi:hypothetical protein
MIFIDNDADDWGSKLLASKLSLLKCLKVTIYIEKKMQTTKYVGGDVAIYIPWEKCPEQCVGRKQQASWDNSRDAVNAPSNYTCTHSCVEVFPKKTLSLRSRQKIIR